MSVLDIETAVTRIFFRYYLRL